MVSVRRPPPAAPRVLKVLGGQSPEPGSDTRKKSEVYSEPHPIVTNVAIADSDEEEDLHDYETLSEHYMTIADFQAQVDDGLSFAAGAEVSVITKNPSGWWYVEMGEKEGWVPSSYLEKSFRPHGYTKPVSSDAPSISKPTPSNATKLNAQSVSSSKPVVQTATKPSLPQTPSQKPTAQSQPAVASKPPVSTKPTISSKPKVTPNKIAEGQSSVAAMAAALSKGLQKSENNISDGRCQSIGATNKAAVRVPAKSSNLSLRRSSSSESLNDTVEKKISPRSKSPPPITVRLAGGSSAPSARKMPTSTLKDQTDRSPTSSSSNLSTQVKFLRKSQENLLALQDDEKSPKGTRKNTTAQKLAPPKPVTRTSTMAATRPEKPPAPARTTQTLKLAELENTLQKGKKPKRPSQPSAPVVTKVATKNPASSKKNPPPRPSNSPALSYVAVADYTAEDDSSLSLRKGDKVDILEQNDGGWWYVSIKGRNAEGWVPSAFIERASKPERPKPPQLLHKRTTRSENSYRAVADYSIPAYEDSGINLVVGMIYEVLEKSDNGWWFVKDDTHEGWAPSSFLEPA